MLAERFQHFLADTSIGNLTRWRLRLSTRLLTSMPKSVVEVAGHSATSQSRPSTARSHATSASPGPLPKPGQIVLAVADRSRTPDCAADLHTEGLTHGVQATRRKKIVDAPEAWNTPLRSVRVPTDPPAPVGTLSSVLSTGRINRSDKDGTMNCSSPLRIRGVLSLSLTSALLLVGLAGAGCQTAYYETMEKLGYHKRDLMVSDVKKARDAQQEAKEQFKSALDRFTKTLNIQGGELQEKYEVLNGEYERSEKRAQAVRDRIASVENVSDALFDEWTAELKQYSNAALRQKSQKQLTQTRGQYAQLIKAMKRAEAKMDPVLAKLKDHVLFLKHNLNAQAIASLKSELVTVEGNVDALIKDLNASIQEADSFIASMEKENA